MGDIVVWLPYASPEEAAERLGGLPDGVRVECYRADGDDLPDSVGDVQFYVLPYMKGEEVLARAPEMSGLRVIQTLTAGYENFLPHVPAGVTLCNAAGVHDASTAELTIAGQKRELFNDTVVGFDSNGKEIVRVSVDEPLIERPDRFTLNTI